MPRCGKGSWGRCQAMATGWALWRTDGFGEMGGDGNYCNCKSFKAASALPGNRLLAPKVRRARSPRPVACLGRLPAGVRADLGARRLAPCQGDRFLSRKEWLRALNTGIRATPFCLPGCSWDARAGRGWCGPVPGTLWSRGGGQGFVGSFKRLMGKFSEIDCW